MNKNNILKAVIAFTVALALVLPGSAAFANFNFVDVDINNISDDNSIAMQVFDEADDSIKETPEVLDTVDWWPMFHHDLNNSGYSTSTAPDTNNVLWIYPTGGQVPSSPAVTDGKVFVGSYDDNIYCLDGSDGSLIWNYTTGDGIWSSPAVADGKVFFGSRDKNVYCLDASDGSLIWNYTTGDAVGSPPSIADGKVFFGSSDDNIYCLNVSDGSLVWNYTTGSSVSTSPAVVNGMVFVGAYDGNVYCLDALSGLLIWKYTTGNCVSSSPSVVNGRIFFGSNDNNVYCLNASNGFLIWNYTTGDYVRSSPAVANGNVFIGSDDNNIYCLNILDGSVVWMYTTNHDIEWSSPAVADGKVYVGSKDNHVYCVDVQNGSLIWRHNTGSTVHSSPAIADGKVFVGSLNGNIYCFGSPLDTTSPVTMHELDPSVPDGDNNWYVSDVTITLDATDDLSGVDVTYYRIDGGNWLEYSGPVVVSIDGVYALEYYSVDNAGNVEDVNGPFDFKIDQTDPTIELDVEKTDFKTWLFTATVGDVTSGVNQVKFYYDDEILGEVTIAPYEWVYSGSYGENATAVVFDNAGNSAQDEKPVSHSNQHIVSFLERLLQRFPILERILSIFF